MEPLLIDQFVGGPTESIRAIAAAVIQGRRNGAEDLYLNALDRWRPPPPRARQFAEESDSRRSLSDTRAAAQRLGIAWSQRVARYGGWVCYGLLLAIPAAVVAAGHFPQLAVVKRLTYVDVVASFALLIAVHVVAAQLAANRLPSPVATGASQSPPIKVGYLCAFLLIVLTADLPANADANLQISAALTATGLLFVLSLIAAALALVRTTDSTFAARSFASARRARYRRAGRRLGALQKRCIEFKGASEALPFVRFEPFPVLTERRTEIRAQRSGFVDANVKRLRHLETRQPWRERRLLLRVTGVLATRIERGQIVASLVPDTDATVDEDEAKRVQHIFPIRELQLVDEVSEAVAGLVTLARLEAEAGDTSGASRVAETMCDMLLDHLDGVRSRRGATIRSGGPEPPIAPSVRALLSLVMTMEQSALQASVMHSVVRRLLREADPAEKVALGIAAGVTGSSRDLSSVAPLLLDCAVRCLEVRDHDGEAAIRRAMKAAFSLNGTPQWAVIRAASELACLAPWLNYFRATPIWRWYWQGLPADLVDEKLVGALSVGGSAVRAGHLSLASEVAVELHALAVDLDNVVERTATEAELRSQFNGRYLGDDTEATLQRFVQFAQRYRGVIGAV
jgi:hypothetical protein